ncbi:hypothetical protein FFLO_03196 [Filobasidium floriforme]|uniref:Zn(2)-C6 fungal-type domain-containing protein n=1 Tax=Filobasidium floriforme TaxID=5210 RepID=A0A8K0JL49_9TREE|nr:hypothetical protein FFLO_03196 [Filobasidium floriforme]
MSYPGSSNEAISSPSHTNLAKKRKRERACDHCRRLQARCDGSLFSENDSCSNCRAHGVQCTYIQASERRGPPAGYIDALEFQVNRLEAAFRENHTEDQLFRLTGPRLNRDDFDQVWFNQQLKDLNIQRVPPLKRTRKPKQESSRDDGTSYQPKEQYQTGNTGYTGNTGDYRTEYDTKDLGRLPTDPARNSIGRNEPMASRYFGRSSGVDMLHWMQQQKATALQELPPTGLGKFQPPTYTAQWEKETLADPQTSPIDYAIWPHEDLAEQLIKAYFDFENLTVPILNRILFKRDYWALRWRHDRGFARVCLAVFALGASRVDDPEVYWPRQTPADSQVSIRHSSGWKYIHSVISTSTTGTNPVTLEQLQADALLTAFLVQRKNYSEAWLYAGAGIRSCIDIGLHVTAGLERFNDRTLLELYKRALWCLVYFDRSCSQVMGRPMAIPLEALDDGKFNLPSDIDDEFWDTGNIATDFQQPSDKPSKLAFFLNLLKVQKHAMIAIDSGRCNPNSGNERVGHSSSAARTFDLALQSWRNHDLPQHLRWSGKHSDIGFLIQSGVLEGIASQFQVFLHRPLLPIDLRQPDPQGIESARICDEAARTSCRIARTLANRHALHHALAMPIFASAIMRLFFFYASPASPSDAPEQAQITAQSDIQTCLQALDEISLGRGARIKDILLDLFTISQPSWPVKQGQSSGSRNRTGIEASSGAYEASSIRLNGASASVPTHESPPEMNFATFQTGFPVEQFGQSFEPLHQFWNAAPSGFDLNEWSSFLSMNYFDNQEPYGT